jgi:hypothetical protein
MESTSRRTSGKSQRQPLSEAVGANVPFGTMVGWRAPGGKVYGVVVGREGKELLVITAYDKALMNDKGVRFYRDDALSGKLTPMLPTLRMSVQRVPVSKTFKHSRVTGAELQSYKDAAKQLQTEGTMEEQSRWIQGAVQHPGRLHKILDLTQNQYDALSKEEKIAKIDAALAKLKGKTGKRAKSKRSALILGKRFIGGIGKTRGRSEGLDLAATNAKLVQIRESMEDPLTEAAWVDQAGMNLIEVLGTAPEMGGIDYYRGDIYDDLSYEAAKFVEKPANARKLRALFKPVIEKVARRQAKE